MKVLWFSNTHAVGGTKGIGCSWIGSLETQLSKIPDIQLGILYISYEPDDLPFSIGNTSYFPIIKPVVNKFQKIFSQVTHELDSETNIPQYLDIVNQFKPDIIHIFGTESDFALIINKTTIPCIIHIQGNLTSYSLKWFSGLNKIDILKHTKKWLFLKGYGYFHDYFLILKAAARERKIFQECRYFMGRTDWDRRITLVLSPHSKYFHCDEIMRSEFYLHQWQPKTIQSNYTIVSTIKSNVYKGLETIFECKTILSQRFPELDILWKVAGIKEQDEISYLVERKYKARFRDYNIQLLGPLLEDELINELLTADLFVHASHIENSPNSVCEGMLLGMPVIATYAGGTPSILSDKSEGLLVQDGDPYVLTGAIIELFRNKRLASLLGENARIKSLIRNNPEKIVQDVMNIYSTILSEN
jgi:glycosyltransferase involved in cell wall biosynthesis